MRDRLQPPSFGRRAFTIWWRNVLVWRKLAGPSLILHFGEPLIYLFGLGYGLSVYIGNIDDMPYLTFISSGLVVSSAMITASLEGTYSVFTRMVPQKTYSAMLATPIEVDDILAGEMLWCATKALLSGIAILIVAALLGAVLDWKALFAIPVIFLLGLCFSGPAIIMASMTPAYDYFNYYFTLVITPMFILGGVFYPVSTMPDILQNIISTLPLSHALAITRPLMAGQPLSEPFLHITVLVIYSIVFYYFAVIIVRKKLII